MIDVRLNYLVITRKLIRSKGFQKQSVSFMKTLDIAKKWFLYTLTNGMHL